MHTNPRPNALWLERITSYKNTPLSLQSASVLLEKKIERQNALLKLFKQATYVEKLIPKSITELMLYEARVAKHFWSVYRHLVPKWTTFQHRKPHSEDTVNILLDIGYHFLAEQTRSLLEMHEVTLAPALFHVAHKERSEPLVYDVMELFRTDVVDKTVLSFLRLKKVPMSNVDEQDIQKFVYQLKKALEKKYFLRDFGQCHTYQYYMELQITKFIKAVNHKEVFQPLHLPTRHESRCACNPPQSMT
ncbi:MAG: hypothetical protein RLZZ76_775 [Candidatus Parcubacteria bacterium]|jgi:CRISPR-associated protein Cas1